MSIHDEIERRAEVAKLLARDGGFQTAADRFERLAHDIRAHCEWADNPNTKRKSSPLLAEACK